MPGPSVPTIALYTLNTAQVPMVLRPNGVTPIDYLNTSAGDSWECVDDVIADDDLSYVYNDNVSEVSSMWTIDAPTPLGNITSVRVVVKAKSHIDPQAATGTFKILYSIDNGVTIHESTDFKLTSNYANISFTWLHEVSGATDWSWADIANLQIGVICSSPSMSPDSYDLTLRPTSDNYSLAMRKQPGYSTVNLWDAVDDTTPDDDSTYVYPQFWYAAGLVYFNTPDHTIETGIINSVTVFQRTRCDTFTTWARSLVKVGGTEYYGDSITPTFQYGLYSYTWLINPHTCVAWTWTDIDALLFGVYLGTSVFSVGPLDVPHSTQCYAVVNYSPVFYSPEIRITQCYAEIRTSSDSTCYLPKPVDIQITQDINTNALNFWSGDREVYGLSRSSKRMIMSGLLWDGCTDGVSTCEDIIQCVRTLGKLKQQINIAGLRYTYMNTDYLTGNPLNYNIISFGWKQVAKKTNTFEWQLELENCD